MKSWIDVCPSMMRGVVLATIFMVSTTAQAQSRYLLLNGGTEVKDAATGLVWRRCFEGSVWNGSTCEGYVVGYELDRALQLAADERARTGISWRLPNIKELASLIDRSKRWPAIDELIFPGMIAMTYWSSTSGTQGCCAFNVNFEEGRLLEGHKRLGYQIRLVRVAE